MIIDMFKKNIIITDHFSNPYLQPERWCHSCLGSFREQWLTCIVNDTIDWLQEKLINWPWISFWFSDRNHNTGRDKINQTLCQLLKVSFSFIPVKGSCLDRSAYSEDSHIVPIAHWQVEVCWNVPTQCSSIDANTHGLHIRPDQSSFLYWTQGSNEMMKGMCRKKEQSWYVKEGGKQLFVLFQLWCLKDTVPKKGTGPTHSSSLIETEN